MMVLQLPMEIVLCFLCFNLLLAAPMVTSSDVFSESLLSLKSELVDHYNGLSDWFLPSSANPSEEIAACSWSGVSCNSNSSMVIGLDLSRKGLAGELSGKQFGIFDDLVNLNLSHNLVSGKLPVSIFNLTNLRTLDISRNNFSGPFPNGVSSLKKLAVLDAFSNSFSGPLPVEVSHIESLKVLNFAGSYFNGPIPIEYGDFKSLEFIQLAGNLLGGEIPPELGKLQTMTHMEIGYNSYQGGIPWQLGNMSELQYLDIAGANLSGPIPKELSNLTKLESLFLFRNQLDGPIPSEFSRLVSLQSLDLSDNQISGKIPESFSEMKNLTLLSLMYNEMEGPVPEAIAELPMLETLLIWSNYFTGPLPLNLGLNSQLKLVDVSTNNLNGSIPPNLCANGMLSKLILFSNNFTGELPPSLSNCSSLVRIRLEDNSLSGPISLNFTSLSDISYVDLSRNKFTGGVPEDIIHASVLEYFNVSSNPELGGSLPPQIWSLPLLQNFSASSCNISGNIPSFQSCKFLSGVELGTNHLAGDIPETISDCQNLSVVDLSHNNLSGSIPEKTGHLASLKMFNVSSNDISGSIPEDDLFRMMDKSAFVENPRLCGLPLHSCSRSREQAEFLWVLVLCIAVVSFIALAVSGVCYIQKGRKRGQWKMVSFSGLPKFTANDILKSFSSTEYVEPVPYSLMSSPIFKVTLSTGITVSVKKIELDEQRVDVMEECIVQLGNARHKNLTRLLGYCYNLQLVYLLYDHLPNGTLADKIAMKLDWASKHRIVMGIANGLYFLHHGCCPAIPHGDLRTTNIVFDKNMEPHLAEFGFRLLLQLNKGSFPSAFCKMQSGQANVGMKEELCMDICNFGEIVFEILSNGRVKDGGKSIQSKSREALLEDLCSENEVGPQDPLRKDINVVLEVVLLCTRSRSSDRPSMEDVLKLLSARLSTHHQV